MNNYNYNPYYQPQYYQTPTLQMAYVNGLEGAKSYIMNANQTMYLRDNNDETIMYEKKTDSVGRYQIKGFKLIEMQVENNAFKTTDDIKMLNDKLDSIIAMISPRQEVKPNE